MTEAQSKLTSLYGGNFSAFTSTALDQGRISSIQWGASAPNGGLIIISWSSDRQTTTTATFGIVGTANSYAYTPCNTVRLSSDDYVLGYRIYYNEFYVYGLELYTLRGETYQCYDSETISDKSVDTIAPSTNYKNNSDFYYFTGWIVRHGPKINGIQLQFTKIDITDKARIEYLPISSFTASRSMYHWQPYYAKYSSVYGWRAYNASGEWLQIDLLRTYEISAVGSMGPSQWEDNRVTQYEFAWSLNENESFANWSSIVLDGNVDQGTEVLHELDSYNVSVPIIAQFLRFVILKWNDVPALVVEAYGHEVVTAEYKPINMTDVGIVVPTTTENEVPADGAQQASSLRPLLIGISVTVFVIVFACIMVGCFWYRRRVVYAKNELEAAKNIQVIGEPDNENPDLRPDAAVQNVPIEVSMVQNQDPNEYGHRLPVQQDAHNMIDSGESSEEGDGGLYDVHEEAPTEGNTQQASAPSCDQTGNTQT